MDANSHFFKSDQTCAYNSNTVGHNTEDYINLKHKIHDLINCDMVVLHTIAPNVNNNPLPNHRENITGMIEKEKDYNTAKIIVSNNASNLQKSVTALGIIEK